MRSKTQEIHGIYIILSNFSPNLITTCTIDISYRYFACICSWICNALAQIQIFCPFLFKCSSTNVVIRPLNDSIYKSSKNIPVPFFRFFQQQFCHIMIFFIFSNIIQNFCIISVVFK